MRGKVSNNKKEKTLFRLERASLYVLNAMRRLFVYVMCHPLEDHIQGNQIESAVQYN